MACRPVPASARRTLGLLLLLAAATSACAALRSATSPPDFKQIEHTDIHDAMHAMAAQVHDLDTSLRDATLAEGERQSRVLAALDAIAAQARGLSPPGGEVSHIMLQEKLPQFIRDVEGARAAASATPPQYFLAGSVSGACMACHRP